METVSYSTLVAKKKALHYSAISYGFFADVPFPEMDIRSDRGEVASSLIGYRNRTPHASFGAAGTKYLKQFSVIGAI
jgi:hypothetical protein